MAGDPIGELVALLARLPGVGERTATRLAFYVLESEPQLAAGLGEAFGELHRRVKRCRVCGNFGADEVCHVCRDARRDASVVCVVARVPDLVAIERSGAFRGRYHVLHGLLAPLDGIHPEHLPIAALEARVKDDGVRELIVATPLTVEGEATALYLADVFAGTGVEVTRIASGMPHGGELEFTDQVTLGRALAGRRKV
jgi:recombination protein RecR